MRYSIVVDSSSDLTSADQLHLEGEDIGFGVAPLTIQAGGQEWPDTLDADIPEMVEFLSSYHGKSGTACPSTGEWIKAFGGASEVFGIAITSHLSGSYNSALVAKDQYEADNPGARVHIVDSLSTGPQMWLMADKLKELMEQKLPFEVIRDEIEAYREKTELIFSLESLNNLANNGRVSPAVAKIASVLGIRVVGLAENGELDPRNKVRGEKKALATIIKEMARKNFNGGKVRISHVLNEPAALKLKDMIAETFPTAQIAMNPARALCSFYAERGGLLVGFETK